MSQLFQYRNRDAEVTVECRLQRPSDDYDSTGRWWFETRDSECNNARWNDTDQEKKPSRHVEFGFGLLGVRFDITVCVTLLPTREEGQRSYVESGFDL